MLVERISKIAVVLLDPNLDVVLYVSDTMLCRQLWDTIVRSEQYDANDFISLLHLRCCIPQQPRTVRR